MQKYLFMLLFTGLAVYAQATVRTVSNNPANPAQYADIATAVAASSSGDTIYIHGSPIAYTGPSVSNKKIAYIGPGYKPDKLLPNAATIGGFNLIGDLCSGSEFQGLIIQGYGYFQGCDSIRILRNYFTASTELEFSATPSPTGYKGFIVEGNYFRNTLRATYSISNTSFQNNVFYTSALVGLQGGANVMLNHNLFYGLSSGTFSVFTNLNGVLITNNIFVRSNAGTGTAACVFNNNITWLTTENTPWAMNGNSDGGGNIAGQNPQMADEASVEAGLFGALILNYTIATGPANNAGSDAKDIGLLYDPIGFYNWDQSRNTRLPFIYSMNVTNPVIQSGGNINVVIEARKNN